MRQFRIQRGSAAAESTRSAPTYGALQAPGANRRGAGGLLRGASYFAPQKLKRRSPGRSISGRPQPQAVGGLKAVIAMRRDVIFTSAL